MHLEEFFYESDEFCKDFEKQFAINLLTDGEGKRKCGFSLSMSEIMTIMIYYHESGYKIFKDFYEKHVLINMTRDFRELVSYNRFIELRQKALFPLFAFAQLKTMASCMGKSFIDSFSLKVCHIKRVSSHKVFKGLAKIGKTSVGWFYGFKLHLAINPNGEIIAFCITPGNVADNNETVLLKITKKLFGKLFGDKGYLINKDLFKKLYANGVEMVTRIRANMDNKLMHVADKLMLRKRGLIESVGNVLKGALSLEHSRHRSIFGFCSHIIASLVAYCFRENKPSITQIQL